MSHVEEIKLFKMKNELIKYLKKKEEIIFFSFYI